MATIITSTRDSLINAALRKLGVIGEGVSANANQLTTGAEALNYLLASTQMRVMPLWKRSATTVELTEDVSSYTIGESQTVNVSAPLKLYQAFYTSDTTVQRELEIKTDYDFRLLPTDSVGDPVAISYTPNINYGTLTVWPTPSADSATGYGVVLVYQKPVDTLTAGSTALSYPQEWGMAIIYGLAAALADEYMLPLADRKYYMMEAEKHLQTVSEFSAEEGSVTFYPDRR